MKSSSAFIGSALFFVAAPSMVAGVIPFMISSGDGHVLAEPAIMPIAGSVMAVAGILVLVHAFWRFAKEGSGTPAPIAPTDRLVVGGAYRYVRNPMYLAVLAIIGGQALMFGSLPVVVYGLLVAGAVVAFVVFYEQPTLSERYGQSYEAYRRAVPGWLPRLTPWEGG